MTILQQSACVSEKELARWARKKDWKANKTVYFLFIPVALYFLVVHYLPMFGIVMAFQDFDILKGVFGSKWVGLENFVELFSGAAFPNAFKNTCIMALMNLTLGFAAPVVFALLVTSMQNQRIRRVCQIITYLPNFIAAVVVTSLVRMFLNVDGPLTSLLTLLGAEKQNWLANANPPVFWLINNYMNVWTSFGFGSILFVAAISNISGDLHEAACIDGANRWQRIWRITIPNIMPMIVMMFTLQVANSFRMGFDKILLLYMPSTYSVADCLYTYTYRMAFGSAPDFGLSAASSLFQSVLGTILLVFSSWLSRRLTGDSLV